MTVTCDGDGSVSRVLIYGLAAAKGGIRLVQTAAGTRGIATGSVHLPGWDQDVSKACMVARARGEAFAHHGPCALTVRFRFPMPKTRLKRDKDRGSIPMQVQPDLDKLLRALCDALVNGGLLGNDARIAEIHATKREYWEDWIGAEVELRTVVE